MTTHTETADLLEAKDKAVLMFDADEIFWAVGDGQRIGFCIDCGDEQDNVDPNAERVQCHGCGESWVYGADVLLTLLED